jgi:hypothetical protein
MNSRVLGGTKASDEFLPNERENLRQRLWICQGETLDLSKQYYEGPYRIDQNTYFG